MKTIIWFTYSYIPWIVYWIFSAKRVREGVIVMFFISLLYFIFEKIKYNYSIMDITTLVYSIVAIIVNYIIKTDVLIVGDGYIGYGVLFIMGSISIYKGYPFMKYYIKKEKDIFLEQDKHTVLNIRISAVWTCVFFINMIVFLVIIKPIVAVTISNVFVLIGIIVTIININKMKLKVYERNIGLEQ